MDGILLIPSYGCVKYIIPITQNLSRVGSYQITTGNVTFHRSLTERIHVTLFSAQNYTATTSRYWAENIVYGCTFLTGRNYTQIYRNSICSWYLGNGDPSAMGNIESVSGNMTSLTTSLISGVGNSTYGINPAGYYYGVIIVTDTAYSGQADILHENSYVECSGITTM